MAFIDDRGRLFGRINLIDALVLGFLLVLAPIGYGAWRLFRTPVPTITSIEPNQVIEHTPTTITIKGTNMRPFLHAKLGEAESGGFLVQSPTLAEVKVGAETPIGTYDLTLFDEGQELVRKPGAIAVIPKPVPPVRSGMAMLHVRFITRPETADVIHVGDLDVSATVVASAPPAASAPAAPAEARSAAIIAIEPGRQQLNSLAYVDAAPNKPYQVQQPMTAFAATLRVPVTMTKTGWQYKDKPVKVGAPIVFETTSGYLEGSILSMTVAGAEDKPVG